MVAPLIAEVPDWLTASGLIGALAFGLLSAFFPPLNAEVYAVAVPAVFPTQWVWHILVMTAGFMAGKATHFIAAQRGAEALTRRRERLEAERRKRRRQPPAWRQRITDVGRRLVDVLDRPVAGPAVILLSAFSGFPPLAVVTVAAGAKRLSLVQFTVIATLGCLVRFGLTAYLVAKALGHA